MGPELLGQDFIDLRQHQGVLINYIQQGQTEFERIYGKIQPHLP
jgi:hypothetical protein